MQNLLKWAQDTFWFQNYFQIQASSSLKWVQTENAFFSNQKIMSVKRQLLDDVFS